MYDVFFHYIFADDAEFKARIRRVLPNVAITTVLTFTSPKTTSCKKDTTKAETCGSPSCCVGVSSADQGTESNETEQNCANEDHLVDDSVGFCGRRWDETGQSPLKMDGAKEAILFIGEEESETLTTLLVSYANTPTYSYSPYKKVNNT